MDIIKEEEKTIKDIRIADKDKDKNYIKMKIINR